VKVSDFSNRKTAKKSISILDEQNIIKIESKKYQQNNSKSAILPDLKESKM
jgi:hypothetical protein